MVFSLSFRLSSNLCLKKIRNRIRAVTTSSTMPRPLLIVMVTWRFGAALLPFLFLLPNKAQIMDASQIDEVRRIVRLEALRAAVFSVASESLDDQNPRLVVDIALEGDTLAASFHYLDAFGNMTMGGAL